MSSVSSRGILWEVLAPIVRWPLQSPARFFTVLGVAVVVLFTGARLSGGTGSNEASTGQPSSTPTGSSVTSSPSSSASEPSSSSPSSTSSSSPSASASSPTLPAAASKTASSFLTAWARPTVAQAAWLAAVKPLATPELAKGLAMTDPRNVPATKVTGALSPREVSPNLTAPTRAVFVGETDAGPMGVTVVKSGAAWLVQSIAPYEGQD